MKQKALDANCLPLASGGSGNGDWGGNGGGNGGGGSNESSGHAQPSWRYITHFYGFTCRHGRNYWHQPQSGGVRCGFFGSSVKHPEVWRSMGCQIKCKCCCECRDDVNLLDSPSHGDLLALRSALHCGQQKSTHNGSCVFGCKQRLANQLDQNILRRFCSCSGAWLDDVIMMLVLFLIVCLEITCRRPSLIQPALYVWGSLLFPVRQLGFERHASTGISQAPTCFLESFEATRPVV